MAPVALPPGFRFHPTDEELVAYYLKRKACGLHIEFDVIGELDLYKAEPWDLPDKSLLKTKDCEWYFFCPRDKKYPNGSRANRATEVGYWKATGKDRKVCSGARTVGMKKTLVFYKGRAPHGERTDWVMHEYRLDEDYEKARAIQSAFVLSRIFKKGGPGPRNGEQYGAPLLDDDEATGTPEEGDPKMLVPFEDETHSILSALPVAIEPWNGRANVAPGALNEGFDDIDRYLEEMCRNDPAESPLGLEFLIDEDAGDLHTPGLTYVLADAADVQVVEGEPSKVPEQISPQAQDLTHTFNLDEFPPVPDGLDFETVMGMTLDDFIHPDPEEADILEEILHAVVADAQEGEAQGAITGLEIHQDPDSLAFSSEFVEGDFLELDDLDVPLDGLYPVLQGEGINWPTIYGEANYSSLQEVDSGIEIRGRTRWAAGNPTEPVEQGMARRRIRLERRAPEHPIQSGVWMNNSELCLSPESLDRLGRNGDHQHVSTYEHIPVPEVRRFDSGEFSDSGNMNSHQAVNLSNSDNDVGDRILASLNLVTGTSLASSTGLSCSSSSQMQMGGVYLDPGIDLELCNPKNLSGGSSDESYVFFEPVRDSLGLLERQFDAIDDSQNESELGRSSAALRLLPSEILDSEASFGAQSSERRDFSSCSSSQLSSVVVETVNSSAVLTSNHCKCLLSSELGLDVLPSDICRESSGKSISHQIPGDHHSLASAVVKMPAVSSSAVPSHQLSKPLRKLLELFGTIPTLPAIAAELPADLKPMKFAENENLFLESGPVLHPLNTTVMSAVLTVTSPLSRHGVAQLEGSHSVKSFAGMASSSCSLDRGYCVYAEERQSPGAKQKPCEVCSCAQGSTTGEPSFEESLNAFSHFSSFGIKHLRAFKRTFILLFFLGTTSALFFTCLLREVRRFSRCMLTTML